MPEEYKPRLLHFHGEKKRIEVKEKEALRSNLDSSDVFILDLGLELYQVSYYFRLSLIITYHELHFNLSGKINHPNRNSSYGQSKLAVKKTDLFRTNHRGCSQASVLLPTQYTILLCYYENHT